MRMSDPAARKLLQEIAQDSANVIFTKHANERMRQRKVTPIQVLDCLRGGFVSEPVTLDQFGYWKLTISHRVAGADLSVSVAIDVPRRAIIITVF